MTEGIINIRFKESATEEDIQAAVSSFYKLYENMIDRMEYKECNEECQAFRWSECGGNGKSTGRHVNEVFLTSELEKLGARFVDCTPVAKKKYQNDPGEGLR